LLKGNQCVVTKEPGDPRFSKGTWGDAESRFLYHVKLELIKQGYDVIKKRMWHDGHIVDDTNQYIRTRKPSGVPQHDIYVYNGMYDTYDAGEEFNRDGTYTLMVDREVFTKI
jgi:hypothetical protein